MTSNVVLSGVQRVYDGFGDEGEVVALENISFCMPAGESLAIVGPSGAGKTTLLQIIAGLDRPTAGEVHIAGQNISELGDKELSRFRNRAIGFVFQFFNLQSYFTAQENVAFPMLLAGAKKHVAMERAYTLLDQIGMGERAHHYPAALSGGEMQRVAVARAIINEPKLILADEPTANLDEKNAHLIIELLQGIVSQGVTLIVITHDSRISRRFSKVLRLQKGRII